MPWPIWFCFLTVPALVGVAFTLALWPKGEVQGLGVVIFVGTGWLFAAFYLKNYWKTVTPRHWIRNWIALLVILPLVLFFTISLTRDPGVVGVFQRHSKANERLGPGTLAPTAPSRHALSWSELGELVACVLPRAGRFSIQLLTSLPPAWWLLAFGIAIWRGKKWN